MRCIEPYQHVNQMYKLTNLLLIQNLADWCTLAYKLFTLFGSLKLSDLFSLSIFVFELSGMTTISATMTYLQKKTKNPVEPILILRS